MKIEVNIGKWPLVVLVLILGLFAIVGFVFGFNPGGNAEPSVFGHSVNEISEVLGATSTGGPNGDGTYNGQEVGYYSGGDNKCVSEFGGGARMCTIVDIAINRPNAKGWLTLL